eukprot:gene18551-57481_t
MELTQEETDRIARLSDEQHHTEGLHAALAGHHALQLRHSLGHARRRPLPAAG